MNIIPRQTTVCLGGEGRDRFSSETHDVHKDIKMGKKRIAGIILFIVGVIISLLVLGLDLVGIGTTPGFGWNQIIGVVVGAIVAIVGVILMFIPQESLK
jgi:cytochrome c biogenesis protein CcdA